MTRVRWSDLDPSTYEDAVAVLISRLHPHVQRIDGSGGDGGRDVWVPVGGGFEIYELKSFTGRLTDARRAQVKRSLERATANSPVAWHLLVPIDPTPGELAWFNKLTESYSFPCDWLGLTWLDGKMAEFPDIARYFFEGASDEVIRLVTQIREEQAALAGGVPDAVERMRAVMVRLNEIDPYYAFAISIDPGGTRITALPKYVGVEQDRPITFRGRFNFPDDDEGRAAARSFQDSIDFGVPTTVSADYLREFEIDAPAGFGGKFDGGVFTIGAASNSELPDITASLRVLDRGRPLCQLPLYVIEPARRGLRGGELEFKDPSGAAKVVVRFDRTDRTARLNYSFSYATTALPGILLPAVRFVASIRSGRSIELVIDGHTGTTTEVENTEPDAHAIRAVGYLEALDNIQRVSGIFFPVPRDLSVDEMADIREADRLLKGEEVSKKWSTINLTTTVSGLAAFREAGLGSEVGARVEQEGEWQISVTGYEIPIGVIAQVVSAARVESWPVVPVDADDDDEVILQLVPGISDQVVTRLLQAEEQNTPSS